MVMEASGSSERKYCHCSGGGQRLMRTSLRLMERSTDRFTTTGTNSELPCCEEYVCGCYALGLIPGSLVTKGTPPHLNSSSPDSDMLPMAALKWPQNHPVTQEAVQFSFPLLCLKL